VVAHNRPRWIRTDRLLRACGLADTAAEREPFETPNPRATLNASRKRVERSRSVLRKVEGSLKSEYSSTAKATEPEERAD
jgi:hypothetical protein